MFGKLSRRLVAVFILTLAAVLALTTLTGKSLDAPQTVVLVVINMVLVEAALWTWRRIRRQVPAGEQP